MNESSNSKAASMRIKPFGMCGGTSDLSIIYRWIWKCSWKFNKRKWLWSVLLDNLTEKIGWSCSNYIMFGSKTVAQIVIAVIRVWITRYWWVHSFHNMLSMARIYELAIGGPRIMDAHLFISIMFQCIDVKIYWVLEEIEIRMKLIVLMKVGYKCNGVYARTWYEFGLCMNEERNVTFPVSL